MNKTRIAILVGVLVLVAGGAGFFVLKPHMEMQELARETCDELNGAIVLQAGPILNKAIGKTKRLGFEPTELGDRMREECPDLMQAMDEKFGN